VSHIKSGSACAGKVPYVSRREAQHILRAQNKSRSGQVSVYKCGVCGQYHIGHRISKREVKAAQKESHERGMS
jgi:ribosomal protein L32